jgi:hypothetical protein
MTSKSALSAAPRHSSGNSPRASVAASSARASIAAGEGHTLAPRRCRQRRAEVLERDAEPPRCGSIASGQAGLEVAESLRRSVPERDRLLDLEIERDPPVPDAAGVLDRYQAEEALDLAGAATLLVGGERRGREPLESALHRGSRASVPGRVAHERTPREVCEGGLRASRRRGRPLCLVGVREDGEIPLREGRGARSTNGEPALRRLVRLLERRAQASLVAVEEIRPGSGGGARSRHASCAERRNRERRVRPGAGKACGLAELAHEQPGSRAVGVAALEAPDDKRVTGPE